MKDLKDPFWREFWNLFFQDIGESRFLEGSASVDEAIDKLVSHLRTLEPNECVAQCRHMMFTYLCRSSAIVPIGRALERIVNGCLEHAEAREARSASEGAHGGEGQVATDRA